MKWHKICDQTDLDIKTSMKVDAGELTIALFHLTDGRFMAVEDRCPHKDGPLSDGIITGSTVTCPLHNWRIVFYLRFEGLYAAARLRLRKDLQNEDKRRCGLGGVVS